MEKIKIIALFGPAGAGKDYLYKKLLEEYKNDINGIVSYTTRPMREGEQDGVEYHFVSDKEFLQQVQAGNMLEWTEFRLWFYGTNLDALNPNKINIGVFNIDGIRTLLKNDKIEVQPILISTSAKTRLMRQLQREENPDINEIVRRYQTDTKDFLDIPFQFDMVINEDWNTDVISDLAERINLS